MAKWRIIRAKSGAKWEWQLQRHNYTFWGYSKWTTVSVGDDPKILEQKKDKIVAKETEEAAERSFVLKEWD